MKELSMKELSMTDMSDYITRNQSRYPCEFFMQKFNISLYDVLAMTKPYADNVERSPYPKRRPAKIDEGYFSIADAAGMTGYSRSYTVAMAEKGLFGKRSPDERTYEFSEKDIEEMKKRFEKKHAK